MYPVSNDELVGYLRSALHNLYDPVHLRRSPLVKLLGLPLDVETAASLQHLLTEAIRALKPAETEPPQSNAWRVYDTLNLQYFRQSSRSAVATQLGISERQLRREQRLALETLAQYVWTHYFVLTRPAEPPMAIQPENSAPPVAGTALDAELNWLKEPGAEQRGRLDEVLSTVQELAQPLAQQWQTQVLLEVEPSTASFPVTQLVIRNILLTLVNIVLPRAAQGPVSIFTLGRGRTIQIVVAGLDSHQPFEPFTDKQNASIDTARQLAAYDGAQLAITRDDGRLTMCLTLQAPERFSVLVIDDNADWLELLKRYAVGSRYDIMGARESGSAHSLAVKIRPAAIFLDVMMPKIDGWQVISELRSEQSTSHIPVVVCSILPLDALALSLGVNAFMQKPITQYQFITMLDQLIAPVE